MSMEYKKAVGNQGKGIGNQVHRWKEVQRERQKKYINELHLN
jgi:hypothetical protein